MKKKSWTRRERRLLRERGGKTPLEELSLTMGHTPSDVREALGGMGITPVAKAPAPREPLVDRILFLILISLFIAVPLVWWRAAKDSFLLPQAILLTTLSLAGLCVWLAGLAAAGEARIRRSPLYPIIILFALSLAPGCFHTANPRLTLDALAWYGVCVLVLLLSSSFPLTAPRARLIVRLLVGIAAVEAAYGICQFFGWDPVFHARAWQRAKIFGTFGNPNFLSAFLAACLPLALTASLGPGPAAARILTGIACAVIPAGILVTGTRGSMLAAVVSSAVVLAYGFTHRRALGWPARGPLALAGALLLAGGVVLVVSRWGTGAFNLSSRFASPSDPASLSIRKRVLYWKTSWEMIRAHPLAGWGPGTYRLNFLDNQAIILARPENASFIPIPGVTLNAHNDYLELWVESGPFALAIFLALIAAAVAGGLRNIGRGVEPGFLLGLLGGFVSLAIVALVCFPLHRAATTLLFWAFAGMIAAAPEGERGRIRVRAPRAISVLLLAVSCVALYLAARSSLVRMRAEAWFDRGFRMSDKKRWHDAVRFYRRGLAIYPRDGEARTNLGLALFQVKKWDEAIAAIQEGFHEVRDFNGHLAIADAFNEKGDMARAIEEYRRVLFLNPGDGRAMNNLGVCFSRRGKKAEALAMWERAAELKPPNADSLANLAVVHDGKGDLAEAKRLATQALAARAQGESAVKARSILKNVPKQSPVPPPPTPTKTPGGPTATPGRPTPAPQVSPTAPAQTPTHSSP
jgi:O-antigen ligase/Tfp pilus assembly protein PilF